MLQARSSFRSTTRCHVLYRLFIMAVYCFSRRRLPDLVTEELVSVLSQKRSYEFKQLFEVVHGNLRRRKAANGGQEILRLRAYDKLQKLVFSGAVKKNGKVYTGILPPWPRWLRVLLTPPQSGLTLKVSSLLRWKKKKRQGCVRVLILRSETAPEDQDSNENRAQIAGRQGC